MPQYKVYNKNNMDVLRDMADGSLHAVVTDCPYGLGKEPNASETLKAWLDTGYHEITGSGFMGKKWDSFVPQPLFWKEVYRVLKPGGYVLAFFGTRTYDWGTLAIRLAGFEIRDCMQWIYGSGFPKSLDVSKAIDKSAGQVGYSVTAIKDEIIRRYKAKEMTLKEFNEACEFEASGYLRKSSSWANILPSREKWETIKKVLDCDSELDSLFDEAEREVIGIKDYTNSANHFVPNEDHTQRVSLPVTAPATDAAKQWSGYGTALKPACELICVARKPLEGTVADNVLKHGCGAINLDGCRIEGTESTIRPAGVSKSERNAYGKYRADAGNGREFFGSDKGRFPSNVILDEEAARVMDEQSGVRKSGGNVSGDEPSNAKGDVFKDGGFTRKANTQRVDSGGASRFFYVAKASKSDRNYGCQGLELKENASLEDRPTKKTNPENWENASMPHARLTTNQNNHATVKPIKLMRYLVRLVKPPVADAQIADFFLGSGTTGIACMLEGIDFIGCDDDENSFSIASARIAHAQKEFHSKLF